MSNVKVQRKLSTVKEWFIKVEERRKGPYSVLDLSRMMEITPDTLVWKEGMADWLPIREIPELCEIFKDPEAEEENENALVKKSVQDLDVLTIPYNSPPAFLWFLLLLLVFLLYLFYQLGV